MIYVLAPDAARRADAQAIAQVGEDELMRNAGKRIAERLRAMTAPDRPIVAFAGPGNNGGDAFAALAELSPLYECTIAADPSGRRSEARAAAESRARGANVRTVPLPGDEHEARGLLNGAVGVDALFGTGARLPLPAEYRHLARALDARDRAVLAIDIPSGTDALTGAVSEDAVRASVTVTLAAAKPGLLLEPARGYVGELWVGSIGIDDAILASLPRQFAALDDAAFLRLLPQRESDTEKRAAGAPLIIAGSAQFPGAAVLCALGAARAGAGYVTVATTSSAAPALRMHLVEQVVVELSDTAAPQAIVDELLEISKRNGAVAIGPGLGLDDRTAEIFARFVAANTLPMVIDASGLFHLSKRLELLRRKPSVVTPHAGEFARLSGRGTVAPGMRVERIREFVDRTGITTLLKGSDTLIYDGSGPLHINPTGTNALATAGTGDVLTGIIATLLAQGLSPVDAARAGAYWHGLAGQYASRRRRIGVIARDVAESLGEALPPVSGAIYEVPPRPLRESRAIRLS
ncbi:MAG: NAD(P)H-hydrate dehydratase [Candidatus Eremiobacteraeota bacterium]|nr:NAD(P)H-hydrate dehydratase [Candidatus Eremiobacteraeota bacterium]